MRELTATAAAESLTTLCDYVTDSSQPIKIIRAGKRACILMCAEAVERREQEYRRKIAALEAQIPRFDDE